MNRSPDLASDAVERLLGRAVERLGSRFRGVFSSETIDRYVHESYQTLYWTARHKQYLPVLAERFATERLTALAQARGDLTKLVPEVLFVCVHNAGRSQMAAALLDQAAAGRVHVRSAGSLPGADIDPTVVSVMVELGIDLTLEFPKPLTDDVVRAADVVITMGCGDACPVYPGKLYVDWQTADPDGQSVDVVRSIRDDISRRVLDLLNHIQMERTTS